jgi:OmcA/MtrC family decaheme c-type cytochrome
MAGTKTIWFRILLVGLISTGFLAGGGCGNGDNDSGEPTPTPTVGPVGPQAGAGLVSEITGASIASDPAGQVSVTFTLTDGAGVPLAPSLAATQNPQQARVRFTIAHLEEYSGGGDLGNTFSRYVNDVNETRPAYDSMGMLETVDAAAGLYRYVFRTMLADVDSSRTYAIGLQVDRTFQGQQLSANPVFDFVPDGGTPVIREGSTTAQCNSCHAPLILHGNRREVRLCTLCHTEAGVDEMGRSIDMRVMIHKIHAGRDLPSVADGPPGSTYAIFSSFARQDVVFAEKHADGSVTGVGFPRPLEECAVCHTDGATAAFHQQKSSTAACTSCHDDVNPSTVTTSAGPPGTNHRPGGYADGQCSACHAAAQNQEFDISVPGAHVIPERSTQLAGLNVAITNVANHGAGQMPTISFAVTDDAGNPLRDLSGLNRVGFVISGPTTDYASQLTLTAVGGGASGTLTGPDAAGVFQYTPATAIPANATGTWAVGAEARRNVELTEDIAVQEAAANPVVTFTVGAGTALARRVVVEDQKCAACHGEFSKGFSIHGNLRNQIEYCVLCHNANESDAARRRRDMEAVAAGDATATIDFKVMIHKIHRGEELENHPYIIYGFGLAPQNFTKHDFAEVLFPGDLRDCETCHAAGSYLLPPFPGTALATELTHLDPMTGDEVVDGHLGPITAVCTSCHDGDEAGAHAETQTAGDGSEACAVCHAEGRPFPVSELHAGRR